MRSSVSVILVRDKIALAVREVAMPCNNRDDRFAERRCTHILDENVHRQDAFAQRMSIPSMVLNSVAREE